LPRAYLLGMPRTPRFVVPGLPHHITQRGNYRQPVFFSPGDRLYFLRHLERRARQSGIDVLGWCLMSNHFHLIAIPSLDTSFSLGLRALLSEYTLHINARQERPRGHLWQGRFYSCALPGARVWTALRYVDATGAEVLVTKAGAGTLTVGSTPLVLYKHPDDIVNISIYVIVCVLKFSHPLENRVRQPLGAIHKHKVLCTLSHQHLCCGHVSGQFADERG